MIAFYPMSKRREGDDNWYELPFEERLELMEGHGRIGRTYAGRVLQLITGATGLSDWEWGVTLLADDPKVFKDIVYEMRFDTVSSRYGEFGPFTRRARRAVRGRARARRCPLGVVGRADARAIRRPRARARADARRARR